MPNINNFFQDQYPATDELQCITLYIPAGDEFKWLLAGLMRLPGLESSYQDPDSEQAQGLADVWRDGYDTTDWGGCVTPAQVGLQTRMSLWQRYATIDAGAALNYNANANQPFGYYMNQNPNAITDQTSHRVFLKAGLYRYRGLWVRENNSAIVTIGLVARDGGAVTVIVSALDMHGLFLLNQVVSADFELDVDGEYDLAVAVTGKNAASTGYRVNWTMHEIWGYETL